MVRCRHGRCAPAITTTCRSRLAASNSQIQLNSRSAPLSLARWAFPKNRIWARAVSANSAHVLDPHLCTLRGVVRLCCVVCLRCNRTLTTGVNTTTHSQTSQSDVRKTNRAGMEVLRVSRVVAISSIHTVPSLPCAGRSIQLSSDVHLHPTVRCRSAL